MEGAGVMAGPSGAFGPIPAGDCYSVFRPCTAFKPLVSTFGMKKVGILSFSTVQLCCVTGFDESGV